MNFVASAFKSDKIELSMDDISLLLSGNVVDGPGVSIVYTGKINLSKPPTVEIGLEDAKDVLNFFSTNKILNKTLNSLMQAISKAEGKDRDSSFPVDFDKNMKGNYPELSKTATAVNVPALPIQDQVNKLLELVNQLQDHLFKCQERQSNMMDYSERLFERISKLEERQFCNSGNVRATGTVSGQ